GNIELAPPVILSRKALTDKVTATYKSVVAAPKTLDEVRTQGTSRQNNLKELYSLLIAPVVSMLPKDQGEVVGIVPHGPLFMVPFAALMDPSGKFLVEQHTLSYAPALGVLRATQRLEDEVKADPSAL